MPNPWLILGAVLFIGVAATVAYLSGHSNGVYDENARWTIAREKQNKEAAQLMAAKTNEVLELERKNAALSSELDKKETEHAQALDKAYSDARATAARAGGLRDPGARRGGGGQCPGGTGPSAAASPQPPAAGGGPLSAEAEQFLFEFAREADQLNLDFERVRADDLQLRTLIKEAPQ